jgi:hypothetical protein
MVVAVSSVVRPRMAAESPDSVLISSPGLSEPAMTQPGSVVKKGWLVVVSIEPVSSRRCVGCIRVPGEITQAT